tara:strand:+ start:10207 stop:10770 length:564 start_codon:yes stop_codon:yes gene_type:complete
MTTKLLEIAGKYVGLTEIAGAKHNPQIVAMFKKSGAAWVEDDETPWCAAFVGAVLQDAGIKGTMKLNARSYLDWGTPVATPQAGDVVVFWRGDKNGWQGHVAFFVRYNSAGGIVVIGGNQGDAVGIATYPAHRLLGFRRPPVPVRSPAPRPSKPHTPVSLAKESVPALTFFAFLAAAIAAVVKFFGG